MNKHHEAMRDEHMNLHANHSALAELHGKGDAAKLHHQIAGNHLRLAEHHHAAAEEGGASREPVSQRGVPQAAPAAKIAPAAKPGAAGADALAIGAANQLHRKGHIDGKTRDRIHRSAREGRKPFGSISGAGHYMGSVDEANSPGTNAGGM